MSMTTTFARFVWIAPSSCSVSWRARCESSTPMIGRMSRRPRTWRTGVESSRIAACCSRMTRSRSATKLTPTGTAMRFSAGSDAAWARVGGGGAPRDAVEEVGVALVPDEQRAAEDVAEQQDDAEDLVRLYAAVDDPLRQCARVRAQRLDAPGLERVDVVVVDRRHLGEDLLRAHHPQELGVRDPLHPRLEKLGAVLAQVRDELAQQRGVDVGRLQGGSEGPVVVGHRLLLSLVHACAAPRPGCRGFPRAHPPPLLAGAPFRKTLVIAAIVSSAPRGGPEPTTLTTSPKSAPASHTAGTSPRISPSRCPRASRSRTGAAIRSSNAAFAGRPRSRATTTKPSPTVTSARTARSRPSPTVTSSRRAATRRPPMSWSASRPSASSSASRLGE